MIGVNKLHVLISGVVSAVGLLIAGAYFLGLLLHRDDGAERALWARLDMPQAYTRRRRRRTLGMAMMALISVTFFVGANFIRPEASPRAALTFWILLLTLLIWLCGIALVDLAEVRQLRTALHGATRKVFFEEMNRKRTAAEPAPSSPPPDAADGDRPEEGNGTR